MTAFNFKKQFADDVATGAKRQTIRARGKRRPPKVGEQLQLYTGMRTAFCRRLNTGTCVDVCEISISTRSKLVRIPSSVTNSWVDLFAEEAEQLAISDGFKSADEFFAWFEENHGPTFSGYLIRWEPVNA